MNGPATAQRPAGGRPAVRRRLRAWHLLVAAVAVAVLFVSSPLFEQPAFVELTVENPTRFAITVHVAGADRGWVAVGTASRQSTSAFQEIADQGDVWIFRFSAQGKDGRRAPTHQGTTRAGQLATRDTDGGQRRAADERSAVPAIAQQSLAVVERW